MRSFNSISNTQQLLHFFDSLIADGYIITILGVKHVLKLSSDLCQKFILFYFQQRKDQLRPIYLVQGVNKYKTEYICSIFHEKDTLRMLREGSYSVNLYGVHSNRNMANLSALWKKELNEIHKTYQKDARGQPIIPQFSNMLLTDVKAKIDQYCPNSKYQFPHIMYIADKEDEKNINFEPSVGNAGTNENKNGMWGRNCNNFRPGTQYIDMYFRRKIPEEEKIDAFQFKESNEYKPVAPQGMHQMMGTNYFHNMVGYNYGTKQEDTNFGEKIPHVYCQTNVSDANFENNNWKSFMARMIQSTNARIAENNMKERKNLGKKRKPNSYAYFSNAKRECTVEDIINANVNKPNSGMKPKAGTVVITMNNAGHEDEAVVVPGRTWIKENTFPNEEVQYDQKHMKFHVSNNYLNMKMHDFDSSYWEKQLTQKKTASKIVYTEEEAQDVINGVTWDQSVDMFFENGYFVVVDKGTPEMKEVSISQERKNKGNSPFYNKNKKHTQQTLLTNFFRKVP
ncbi:Uncharacterized protein PCOAH_00028820 [Plasmodium coatneyi]|uniref:Uncharacterized protein n=1 Tax=Plasmodium coatneyi TaxID=208452 RepID=A0A1B1E0V2_9APIC|nr:Uncharacterized protein PCOAH_00028820 [Plasmodium coatneyi]ANQ08663.1 Uncharacterized protein PCOAH_00028820 [Plasmodium coatneyi]